MKNLLEVTNLHVRLVKRGVPIEAVDEISFSIKEGEILGLAGESGCGKTLAALSITGLLPQNAKIINGSIKYKNIELRSMNEKDYSNIRGKEIGAIFQEYRDALNPLIKSGKQIAETLELAGVEKTESKRRATEMLLRLGFEEPEKIYNLYPYQLSGGMCQRIMTAIAAIGNPKLLLADEPSSALDTESQEKILSLLKQMNQNYGATILIISHDLSIIRQFCSRYLIMYAGKIIEEGPSHLLSSPLHPYTKGLTAAIPSKEKKGGNLKAIPVKAPYVKDEKTRCPFAPRCGKAQSICHKVFPPATRTTEERVVYCNFPENEAANG
ncbi:MAG: ABC transporter ATP-binding protein [Treponema sp.]|jgi:peptide/nickel transport system ATP-binding protein|nr:ABC transporter ATP-binding protein [Treponema sp.]